MNVTVNAAGAWQHQLDIEIPTEEVEDRLDQAARGIQRRVALPGFRKGKAPLPLVRQHFAEAVEREFLEDFVPQATGRAVDQAKLHPVVPPLVHDVSFTPGGPMKFRALVDVRPEVEVRDYRGLPTLRRHRVVEEGSIQEVIDRLREKAAVFVDLDRPAGRGDVVLVDSVRLDANGRRIPSSRARGVRLELGAPEMIPDLENGLLGAEEGQERTIPIAYPADYPTPELAGKSVRYLVRVKKIQEKKLRDPDDNFAKEVLKRPASFEDLRAAVRRDFEAEEENRSRREVEEGIVGELIRRHPFDLPERLVEWTLDRMIREAAGQREPEQALYEEMSKRYRPAIERSLKREVLLSAVAGKEQIAVSDDDVAAEIERMAQADPQKAARVRARYQSAERRQALKEGLMERKALDWLVGVAEIKDEAEAGKVVPATR